MYRLSQVAKFERGVGLVGSLLILSAFGIIGIAALKCLPAYMEYFTIQSTVKRIANDVMMQNDDQRRMAFEHQAKIDMIESVTSRDLVITGNQISVSYEKKIPFYHNLSLLLAFKASSDE